MDNNTLSPKKFVMQQVFEILLRRPATKEILAYLTDVKTSGLENTVEMVYPTGGRGNAYIGNGFAHSKKATMNISVATFNTEVMAMQNGTELATGNTNVTHYEVIECATADKLVLAHKPEVIEYMYAVNEDGTYGTKLTFLASGELAEGQFNIDSTDTTGKTLSAYEGSLTVGEYYAVVYEFKTNDKAQKMNITTDGIPAKCLVTAFGLASDICSGELFPAVIEGNAQVDGNWNFDLSADGEPAVHDLKMEFVKDCFNSDLYTFIIHTNYADGEE